MTTDTNMNLSGPLQIVQLANYSNFEVSTVDAAGNVLMDLYAGSRGDRAGLAIRQALRAAADPASPVAVVRLFQPESAAQSD